MIWTEGSDRLKIFVDYLNNIHPTTKFTSSYSLTNVPFLDIMVSLHNGIIETDLFAKPTDKHQHPGGHSGIFWVGMCRPELQMGTPF